MYTPYVFPALSGAPTVLGLRAFQFGLKFPEGLGTLGFCSADITELVGMYVCVCIYIYRGEGLGVRFKAQGLGYRDE